MFWDFCHRVEPPLVWNLCAGWIVSAVLHGLDYFRDARSKERFGAIEAVESAVTQCPISGSSASAALSVGRTRPDNLASADGLRLRAAVVEIFDGFLNARG